MQGKNGLAGQQLGCYRLERRIGVGGMGEVYVAGDTRLPRQVAIKLVRFEPDFSVDEEATREAYRLFQREMRAVSMLNHPHILPLFDFGEEALDRQVLAYLVMPFCPEGSLADWLRRRGTGGRLRAWEVAHCVGQAAEALQHAHDHGLVHLDVKPGNFLVRSSSGAALPDLLLADFGIARIISTTSMISQSVRGTPSFMAPEQWEGAPIPATDQYALAMMAYQLLTGRPPFNGSMAQLMHQHFTVQPPAPSTRNSALTSELDRVMLLALSKRPEQRFASISAFARAFQQAAQPPAPEPIKPVPTPELAKLTPAPEPIRPVPTVQPTEPAQEPSPSVPAPAPEPSFEEQGVHVAPRVVSMQVEGTAPALASVQTATPTLAGSTVSAVVSPPPSLLGETAEAVPDGEQHERTPTILTEAPRPLLHPDLDAQPAHRSRWVRAAVTVCLLALLVTSGWLGVSGFQNHQRLVNATATAARQAAITHVQATTSAQEIEATQTTIFAQSTASAQVQATATAQAVAQNSYPSYMAGHGTLVMLDPLHTVSEWYPRPYSDSSGRCFFANNALHILASQSHTSFDCPSSQFGNFALEVQMTIVKGDCGEALFSSDPLYIFNICSDGSYSLWKETASAPGATFLAGERSSAINAGLGTNNILGIVANSVSVIVYINRQQIASDTSGYTQGPVNLGALDNVDATEVIFRNARIWS